MRLFLTVKPHKSAKRNPIECVLGLPDLAEQIRAGRISDAEFIDTHLKYLRHNKMAKLVGNNKKNEYGEYKKCNHLLIDYTLSEIPKCLSHLSRYSSGC